MLLFQELASRNESKDQGAGGGMVKTEERVCEFGCAGRKNAKGNKLNPQVLSCARTTEQTSIDSWMRGLLFFSFPHHALPHLRYFHELLPSRDSSFWIRLPSGPLKLPQQSSFVYIGRSSQLHPMGCLVLVWLG